MWTCSARGNRMLSSGAVEGASVGGRIGRESGAALPSGSGPGVRSSNMRIAAPLTSAATCRWCTSCQINEADRPCATSSAAAIASIT